MTVSMGICENMFGMGTHLPDSRRRVNVSAARMCPQLDCRGGGAFWETRRILNQGVPQRLTCSLCPTLVWPTQFSIS